MASSRASHLVAGERGHGHAGLPLEDFAIRRRPPPDEPLPRASAALDGQCWRRIRELASDDPRGVLILLVAATAWVATRWARSPDLVVALPGFAGRGAAVPVRLVVPTDGSVRSFLRQARDSVGDAATGHGAGPREAGQEPPAISVAFASPGREASVVPVPIAVTATPDGDSLHLRLVGDPMLHRPAYLAAFAEELVAALGSITDLDADLSVLGPANTESRSTVGATDCPQTSIVEEFLRHVERTPDAPAVVVASGAISYRELEVRSRSLTRWLRDGCGIAPGDRVGLQMPPSERMIVAILAVLRAAAVYVPLDPCDPPSRTRRLLEATGARAVVHDGRSPHDEHGCDAAVPPAATGAEDHLVIPFGDCLPDEWGGDSPGEPFPVPSPDSLAYIMFTSGSTGEPKLVPIEHRSVVRLALGLDDVRVRPGERVAQLATPSFDGSVFEIFGALLNGAALHVAAPAVRGRVDLVARYLRDERIDVAFLTTALFNSVVDLDVEALVGRRRVVFGGEAASTSHVARALELEALQGRLVNGYGPTEATVFATTAVVEGVAPGDRFVPIGRPIGWTRVHVLDVHLRPLPPGVPGEICIAGCGVSPGGGGAYPDPRFGEDPFAPGDRLYRTGDLGCLLPDGSLRCIGRMDDQVKVRGFRVEPAEIAAALRELPGVTDAAVVVRDLVSGDKTFVALATGHGLQPAVLRSELAARLPSWMLPSAIHVVDELPLTASGKIDRAALHALVAGGDAAIDDPVEAALAAIWIRLLGPGSVGRHDNFFRLGGHSLTMARLVMDIHEALGADLELAELFRNPTIAGQAVLVRKARVGAQAGPIEDRVPLTDTQRRIWFDEQTRNGDGPAYLIPEVYDFDGDLDVDLLVDALHHLVQRHESLRLTFAEVDGEPWAEVGSGRLTVRRELVGPGLSLEEATRRLCEADTASPMDLAHGPLVRATLLTEHSSRHRLLLTVHHLAVDGWSMGVLLHELTALYRAGRERGADVLAPPLPYATIMRLATRSSPPEASTTYWASKLAGATRLELPTDGARPSRASIAGRRQSGNLGATFGFVDGDDISSCQFTCARSQEILAPRNSSPISSDVLTAAAKASRASCHLPLRA